MLTSSSSPQLSSIHYSAQRSPYSFRASSSNHYSTSPTRTRSSASAKHSTSASPSATKVLVNPAPPPGFRSPKRPTADAATQYSPPVQKLADQRSVTQIAQPHTRTGQAEAVEKEQVADGAGCPAPPAPQDVPTAPPPEPKVRETPRSLAAASAESSRAVSPTAPASARHVAKRQKQSSGQVEVLPHDYAQCEPKILATLVSGLLMDLIAHNDNIRIEEVHLTRFHSRTPPGISVHDYLQRLTFHATLPSPVLLAMVNYIDKLCEAFPIFTINSLTVHRFLIAAATVAAKGLCDVFWTNSTYAKVGGVSKRELALLELELLTKTEWRIVPDAEHLGDYYRNLIDGNADYSIEKTDISDGPSTSASSDSIGTDTMDTE